MLDAIQNRAINSLALHQHHRCVNVADDVDGSAKLDEG